MHPTYEIVLALAFILGLWFERRKRRVLEAKIVELEELCTTDALTGLMNQRGIEEEIARLGSMARRTKRPIGVLMIDLDHFKKVNDTHGHGVGDDVLREIGRLLRDPKTVRISDRIGRSRAAGRKGGEEFIFAAEITCLDKAVPRPPHESVTTVGERILEKIRACKPGGIAISASIGGAVFDPAKDSGDTLERAIGRADECLYQAKAGGRDRLIVSTK